MVAAIYLILSLFLVVIWRTVHTRLPSRASPLRNACLVADITAISTYTAVSDTAAIILLPMYLSAIIGYGMRFGHRYLIVGLFLSVFEFLFVAAENKYLSTNTTVKLTYLLSMSFVPIYTILLLKKYALILEAYIETSRQKEEFIAIMSHEFRAPLHSIISIAELCQSHLRNIDRGKTSPHLLAIRVKDILRCSERMLAVANRVAAQQCEVTNAGTSDASVHNTYRDIFMAIRICDIYAKRKHLDLSWAITGNTPPLTTLSSSLLQEILINLLDNSIKNTTAGLVRLTVQFDKTAEFDGVLQLVVTDSGTGIAAPGHRYVRESDTRSSSLIGRRNSGLGLAITRRHVERLGGSIEYVANPSGGTRLSVRLPLSVPTEIANTTPDWLRIHILATRSLTRVEEDILIACKLFPRYALKHGGLDDQTGERLEHFSATFSDQPLCFNAGVRMLDGGDFSAIPNVLFVTSSPFDESLLQFRPNFSINVDDPLASISELMAFRMLAHEISPSLSERELGRSGNATILLIDDSEITLEATQRVLENSGFRCLIAPSIAVATMILRTTKIDLVIADLYIGDEDFLEFFKVAKAGLLFSTPVIFVTAETDGQIREAALAMGAFEVITKPVSASGLLECVWRVPGNFICEDSTPGGPQRKEGVADWQILDEVFESNLDYEAFVSQIRQFEDDLLGDAIRALGLIKGGQYRSLWRLLHKMTGLAMLLGAKHLAGCLSNCSQHARSGVFPDSAQTEIENLDLLVYEFVATSVARYEPAPIGPRT